MTAPSNASDHGEAISKSVARRIIMKADGGIDAARTFNSSVDADYAAGFFHVLNWDFLSHRYQEFAC